MFTTMEKFYVFSSFFPDAGSSIFGFLRFNDGLICGYLLFLLLDIKIENRYK